MAQIVVFVLAILTGVASHHELTEFNKTSSEGKVPPIAAGVAGFFLGLLVAFIAPALVLGVLVGLVCFHEVQIFEREAKERLLGMQTAVWAGVAGIVGFVGGSVVALSAWFVVCVFAGFAGAFYLLYMEKQRLQAENRTWISENQRLLLERGARGLPATAPASAPPATAPVVPAPPVVAAPAPAPAPVLRAGAVRKPTTWGATPRPGSGAPYGSGSPKGGGDFLPRH
jgi:hypothetical protein